MIVLTRFKKTSLCSKINMGNINITMEHISSIMPNDSLHGLNHVNVDTKRQKE